MTRRNKYDGRIDHAVVWDRQGNERASWPSSSHPFSYITTEWLSQRTEEDLTPEERKFLEELPMLRGGPDPEGAMLERRPEDLLRQERDDLAARVERLVMCLRKTRHFWATTAYAAECDEAMEDK